MFPISTKSYGKNIFTDNQMKHALSNGTLQNKQILSKNRPF